MPQVVEIEVGILVYIISKVAVWLVTVEGQVKVITRFIEIIIAKKIQFFGAMIQI